MKQLLVLFGLLLLWSAPAAAQSSEDAASEEGCKLQPLDLSADASSAPALPDAPAQASGAASSDALTPAEARVKETIAQEGVHVVHFWAPWCPNSLAELEDGWSRLVRQNEDVSFTFVTIWNDGKSGADTLRAHNVPKRVVELTQPNPGEERLRSLLNLPVTWVPSTWIFHKKGELAFALNYGEMQMETLQELIDAARSDWAHN